MKPYNIMLFPSGSEIALEVYNALKFSKFVKIFGGTSVSDHSEFVYENLITNLPFIKEATFINELNRAIHANQIDYIYPAYDEAQVYLMEHSDEIDATIVSAPYETVRVLRSKKTTYEQLCGESFVPKTWENIGDIEEYPVFVKPAESQGSQGARVVYSEEELRKIQTLETGLVICEYLTGKEYTVDCFTKKDGKLLSVKPRERQRTKAGIAVRSEMITDNIEFFKIAQIINEKFEFNGAWFFQLRRNAMGELKLLEVSPRIPGTNGLSRNSGVNYPLLTLFQMWGFDVSIIDNNYDIVVDRAFHSVYRIDFEYEVIYLDFDDTLIVNGKVNTTCITLIYQAIQKGKRIILLSKHTTDIYVDLKKWHIDTGVFDEIIVIDKNDEKTKYIHEQKAIFIDDSFAERRKVHDVKGIPVFDVDMIESLIDWRM